MFEGYEKLEAARDRMREIVTETFDRKRSEGKLSLVHDIDHVEAVARYGSMTAEYLTKKLGIPLVFPEHNAITAEIAGWAHDIVREATEEVPHGPKGANEIRRLMREDPVLSGLCDENIAPVSAGMEIVASVVSDHEMSYSDAVEKYKKELGVPMLPIIQGLIVGDKVFEASGPRVLERRAFFVGKERMQKDLKGMFKYPQDSHIAVLGETLIRLYSKNHAKSYPPEIRPIVDRLHSYQYEFLGGLLLNSGMDESEAADYFLRRGFTKFDENVSGKIKEQHHMSGEYFSEKEFPMVYDTVRMVNSIGDNNLRSDIRKSSRDFVRYFVDSDTPTEAVERYVAEGDNTGLKWFRIWMDGVVSYRSGEFTKKFERLLKAD